MVNFNISVSFRTMVMPGFRLSSLVCGNQRRLASLLLTTSVVLVGVMCLLAVPGASAATNLVTICIKNCQYCKEMYHDHFDGGRCADFCIRGGGHHIVDCGEENAILPFFLQRQE